MIACSAAAAHTASAYAIHQYLSGHVDIYCHIHGFDALQGFSLGYGAGETI